MRCGTSNLWGNTGKNLNCFEQGLIAASLIAFSAERSGQRVGAFLFDREINRYFPPRKGRRNVLAFISGALHAKEKREEKNGKSKSSNLLTAITGAQRLLKRRSMVVLISDFLSIGWEQELGVLGRRHDVIAVRISDPKEKDLPYLGLVAMKDPETGVQLSAPTGSAIFREAWSSWHRDRRDYWMNMCNRAGVSHIELPVNADAASELTRFFSRRGRNNAK